MPTYTNERSGSSITTDLSPSELARRFAETAPEGHWAWFWMAKHVQEMSEAKQETLNMMEFLADSFLYAAGMGLKRPMIRLMLGDRRYKIYLSNKGTLCLKSGPVHPGTGQPRGNEQYVGCWVRGKFLLPSGNRTPDAAQSEFLRQLEADPVNFMAQCSKDMNRCCYCWSPLEDPRSKQVGYGPICADHWGLPWGAVNTSQEIPSFAQMWGRAATAEQDNVRTMCRAIRANPRDEVLWAVLGDALEDAGFPKRPEMPEEGVRIPAV